MNKELTSKKNNQSSAFVAGIKERFGPLVALAVLVIVISVSSEFFLTGRNIVNLLRQVCTTAMVAYGATLCLISGNIDLSCGSVVALASVVVTILLQNLHVPFLVAVLVAVLAGGVVGLANGIIITRTGLPPFIVTLAMQSIVRGAAYFACDASAVHVDSLALKNFGSGFLWIIPIPFVVLIVVTLICIVITKLTVFGRNIFAVGGNRDAAKYAGIDVNKVDIKVYVIAGLLAAIGGVIFAARVYSGQPTAGAGLEGDAISAAVLGGVAFSGGSGSIMSAVIGTFIIGVMNNAMNLWELSSFWQLIVKGLILLVAVYADAYKKQRDKKV